METFNQITTVNHQGIVIAFARAAGSPGNNPLYYKVPVLPAGSLCNPTDHTGFIQLDLPEELRPAGTHTMTIHHKNNSVLGDSGAPFRVVSDQQYVCLFRQSVNGTLLLNRYLLKKTKAGEGAGIVLEPAWETRAESSAPGAPEYMATEPVTALFMLNHITDGRFDVAILHNEEDKRNNWQFFVYNPVTEKTDLFAVPMDQNGLFDLTSNITDNSGAILPDQSFSLQEQDEQGNLVPLSFIHAPAVISYIQQEHMPVADSQGKLIKRAPRLMLAAPVVNKAGTTLLSVTDFSISRKGALSRIQPVSTPTFIRPANYSLYFDEHAYVQLEDTRGVLKIGGPYEISLWIYQMTASQQEQRIIGGATGVDPRYDAPYISVTDGGKIKTGFGDGEKPVSCITQQAVITPGTWHKITVRYEHNTTAAAFSISVNDHKTPVLGAAGAHPPCGAPVSLVSHPTRGFRGMIEHVQISTHKDGVPVKAGYWKLDAIVYDHGSIPFAPDETPYQHKGFLYGPKLIPSAGPAFTDATGHRQVDEQGLSTYVGLLDYVQPRSSPQLNTGTDGLLHLCYPGADDQLYEVQYDVEMKRAVFQGAWEARAATPYPDNRDTPALQKGNINFIARRSGTQMNQATVTISPCSDAADRCTVHFDNKDGTTETWNGVPRNLHQFNAVINGQYTYDPADPLLKDGKMVFYDIYGRYPLCYLPVLSDTAHAVITFITLQPDLLPLYSVAVRDMDLAAQTCTAILQFNPKKWNRGRAREANQYLTQVWTHVPINCQAFLNTLNGAATGYNYHNTSSTSNRIYKIKAAAPEKKDHPVLFLTQSSISQFMIQVADSTAAATCDVTIQLKQGGKEKKAVWKAVPRQQQSFSLILNGDGSSIYDYNKYAEGSYQEIAALIIVSQNGQPAIVTNHLPGGADDLTNMRGTASLFTLFNEGLPFTKECVTDHAVLPAAILQNASGSADGQDVHLVQGSTLFSAVAATAPVGGLAPMVTDIRAKLVQYGSNGGWRSSRIVRPVMGKNCPRMRPAALS